MRRPAALVAATILTLAVPAACGSSGSSGSSAGTTTTAGGEVNPNAPEQNQPGDIPDNQVFVAYRYPDGSFTVRVPEGWSRTQAAGSVTFTDNFNSVQLSTRRAPAAPTVDSVTSAELPTIEAAAPGYQAGSVESISRSAGDAVLVTYQADSPPDPVTGQSRPLDVERYEFFHGGTEIIVTLSGPKGADNVDPWRTVTDSLRFGS